MFKGRVNSEELKFPNLPWCILFPIIKCLKQYVKLGVIRTNDIYNIKFSIVKMHTAIHINETMS